MEEERKNLIIFPKWKDNLEGKAKTAMQENRFSEAYDYFHQLTENGVQSHEVMTGKLICMMELNMQDDAEDLCEELIAKKDTYFASYIHIYATLLFQSSKYNKVMFLIDDALTQTDIPSHIIDQLRHMYQLSKELQQQEDKKSYIEVQKQLEEAIKQKNDRQQWYMVKRLLQLEVYHDKLFFREMLKNPEIHPVVKTALLEYYQKVEPEQPIHIEKFQLTDEIHMRELDDILPVSFITGVTRFLDNIQQQDPTKYQMILFLLERFAYVYTPFLPQEENYEILAESLLYYVSRSFQYFDQEDDHHISVIKEHYLKMIDISETLYGTILDV
ncbi:hypothetical protein GI584_14625 [Gracilibacillus salitolerans]|uniref:Tetratricopeptide repeat protein n=1 Tax=Gracilibacillus salitolerans TaxID=2663022 RepID=A0A5Q2TQP9_9BACI|nr:hypothetical protein [Gracilibacillus salitolerans]QGH35208.1 hypothetical protein GI584_14625 [Gracilibacillus salitolerans]